MIPGFFFALVLPLFAETPAANPALAQQLSSDLTTVMTSLKDKCDPPLTDDDIRRSIPAAIKNSPMAQVGGLVTTPEETGILASGKSIITNEQLKEAIQESRNYKTILPISPLLLYYEALQTRSGLNQYQQLLAFRLAEYSLKQAKKRDEIQAKIKKIEANSNAPK